MNLQLSSFATRVRGLMEHHDFLADEPSFQQTFDSLALELFALHYHHNPAYRKICDAREATPATVRYWAQVPFVPTAAFKDLELSCILPAARTAVFHSSGTTEQRPSRHFHGAESLALYEVSLWRWFKSCFSGVNEFVFLTPNPEAVPRSSLVYMFDTIRRNSGRDCSRFFGTVTTDGAWALDFDAALQTLRSAGSGNRSLNVLGTAFSLVHLLDYLAENNLQFALPAGSRVMETGGYKNRSRTMPKAELHALITKHLGVPAGNIICEYGMSELSSQAYDQVPARRSAGEAGVRSRCFHFPPWARVHIVSPETGNEVSDGQTGLIRIFDLANVFSVAAIQTEDLAIRRDTGFELIGRVPSAEPRGCSLMTG